MNAAVARRPARVILLTLVVALGLAFAGSARADETDPFGGYDTTATGEVLAFHPSLPGLSIVEEPVAGIVSLSHSTLSTGGSAFARSSTFWPGDVAGNFGSLLAAADPRFGAVPNDPIRAEAREFDGQKSTGVPGITMSAYGSRTDSRAESSVGTVKLPGFVEIGSASSLSESLLKNGQIGSTATVTLQRVKLLGGLFTLDTLKSVSSVGTNAKTAINDGKVTVSGLALNLDLQGNTVSIPLTVDSSGVHVQGQNVPVPLDQANQALAQVMKALNAQLVLGGSVSSGDGAGSTSRGTTGLMFVFHTPPGSTLPSVPGTPCIPPQVPGAPPQLQSIPAFGTICSLSSVPPCTCMIVLGSTQASASAQPAFTYDFGTANTTVPVSPAPPLPATSTDVGSFTPSVVQAAGVEAPPVGSTLGTVRPPARVSAGLASASEPLDYRWAGVPVGAVLAALAAGWWLSRRVRRYMQRLMSMGEGT